MVCATFLPGRYIPFWSRSSALGQAWVSFQAHLEEIVKTDDACQIHKRRCCQEHGFVNFPSDR